jgi:hypothetical protein
MTRRQRRAHPAIIPILFTLFICTALISGCDITDSAAGSGANEGDQLLHPLNTSDLNYVRVSPKLGKSGVSEYKLMISIKDSSPWRPRLGGIRILSRSAEDRPVIIRDDGRGADLLAGDGIFSGTITEGCLETAPDQVVGKEVDFSCTLKFVGPGQECGNWGACPERVHRSTLWGLIEYSTDIVVCVCLVECSFSND